MKRALGFMNKSLPITTNTYIGGVSGTISSASILASTLGISVGAISNFTIVGSDIKCKITGSYATQDILFDNRYGNFPNVLTYYIDSDNLVTSLGKWFATLQSNFIDFQFNNVTTINYYTFEGSVKVKIFNLPALTTIISGFNFYGCSSSETINIPLCTQIGTSHSVNDNNFSLIKSGTKIYAHSSMATINGGGVEADLAAAISAGATVTYVLNSTAPNPVTSLAIGNIYNTEVQLNFTNPTGSTNTYAFSEVYKKDVNGNWRYISKIVTGDYVTGLTASTDYDFKVVARDIYYNGTESLISATTNTTPYPYPAANIVSQYAWENNVLDTNGVNNGTATAITYATGISGQGAVFNGSSSYVSISDSNSLSFNDGTSDLPFSLTCRVKMSALGNSMIFTKRDGTYTEYQVFYDTAGFITVDLMSGGNTSNYKREKAAYVPTVGTWFELTVVYTGSGRPYIYIDTVLKTSTQTLVGTYVKMTNTTAPVTIGKLGSGSSYYLNGMLDCFVIWNVALSDLERTSVYNRNNAGYELI